MYISGSDAKHAYQDCRDWVVGAAGSSYAWSRSFYHEAIDWGDDHILTMVDHLERKGLQVVTSSGKAIIWVEDAGERALVTLEGEAATVANQVTQAVDTAVNNLASNTTNAATAMTSWASSAGSTVVAAYDTSSGWVVGTYDDVEAFAESVGEDIGDVANDIGDAVESTADTVGDAIVKGWKSIF